MITANIKTQVRAFNLNGRYQTREAAIDALQNAVYALTPEDGRCKFMVMQFGKEIYSWEYQPTFREEPVKKAAKPKPEPKYEKGHVIYVLLNGYELSYDNFFHNEYFDTVTEARVYMKEMGYSTFDYRIVHEYFVTDIKGDAIYGSGLGFTTSEAKEKLNKNIGYYGLAYKNGRISEIK